ncbi:MAG: UDP-N-acetylmuramoyl-tripeptide--D-alanyl-D-alanine ligase [Gammaproteobacteria bacterium]|nr:UDP-N-acetylmuramoyl-tripeptide--D-alanyl-D-alanine ligase [Gammaproteobacteria bacterium]
MSWLNLSAVAEYSQGKLHGADVMTSGVSIDTRTMKQGELYVALKGERFDGHDYVEDAQRLGASAVMVSTAINQEFPHVVVDDTRLALGRLAAGWRNSLNPLVVGLTGSNGKTTVKEMIAGILGGLGRVNATRGNLNNDIGVPLTLLSLSEADQYAVVEMGANHHGEIEYLTSLANPDIGLVNNAGPAHLEGFGDIDGVARGKGELFAGLKPDAVAVINADDPYADYWMSLLNGQKVVRFGLEQQADVTGLISEQGLEVRFEGEQIAVHLSVPGRHNCMNALAAAAVSIAAGASLQQIRDGLESFSSVHGRLESQKGVNGARIFDDTYNANPASLNAAIEWLAEQPGVRYLVLGDMGELGELGPRLHAEAGQKAKLAGIDNLYCIGELACEAAKEFGEGAQHYNAKPEMIRSLKNNLDKDVTVLVKGSRSMAMEEVVQELIGREHAA